MPRTKLLKKPWTEKAIAPCNWEGLKVERFANPAPAYRVEGFAHVSGFKAVQAAINWEPNLFGIQPSVEESAYIFDCMRTHKYAAFWVMKRQAKVLNPTLKKLLGTEYPAFMASQRHGYWFNSLYDLAYGIFDHYEITTGEEMMLPCYASWSEWWLVSFLELANSHVISGITGTEEQQSRQDYADYLEGLHADLKVYKKPESVLPHMSNLLSAAISIAKPSKRYGKAKQAAKKDFRDDYYTPMLRALWNYKVWVRSLEKNTGQVKPIWQKRDPTTKHFYSHGGGRKKTFSYQKSLNLI